MTQNTQDTQQVLEERSRTVFDTSVEAVDFGVRSRLTQARHAALEAAAEAGRRPWFLRLTMWTPAAGVAAALLVGVALWTGMPGTHAMTGDPGVVDDLDIVAASDGGPTDTLDMLQDDLDFYDFADKVSNPEPTA
jgi:negative regulator of sigma E activity